MKHNQYPSKSKLGRKFTAVVAAGLAVMSMTGDAKPKPVQQGTTQEATGGQNTGESPIVDDTHVAAAPNPGQRDPALEAKAADAVAEGLTNSFKPRDPNAQMGGEGYNGVIVLDGVVEAQNTQTGETIRVVDPIVPSTQLGVNQLPTSWVVVQGLGQDGLPAFKPVDLNSYDWVTITPADPAKPYLVTHGRLEDGKVGQQMRECDANGNSFPGADIAGQIMSTEPIEPGQPLVPTPTPTA